MKHLPNLFTLLNLFFGCIAIVMATQSGLLPMYDNSGAPITDAAGNQFINLPEKIWEASFYIFLAAVVDFLDGFIARIFNATSNMGKQLDSLADVVSFGVAPAIIIYQFLRLSYAQQEDGLLVNMIWLLPAFILPCAGAWRLAKFNIDTDPYHDFKGLPIPAVGLLLASFPLIYWTSDQPVVIRLLLNEWFWYGLILLLSFLMASNLPMMSLKSRNFQFKNNIGWYILLIAGVVAVIFLRWLAVPVIFVLYVILSLTFRRSSTKQIINN
jgi:CDP-diacylglycerol---serine O-phosphatidyltransferase